MKLQTTVDTLRLLASAATKAVASRSTLPVLGCILIQAFEDGRFRMTGTNLALGLSITGDAAVKEAGAIAMPAKTFLDIVNTLPHGADAQLKVDAKTPTTLIVSTKTPKSAHTLKGLPAEEFPLMPDGEGVEGLSIIPDDFRHVLSRVPLAAATDEARPILTVVNVVCKDGRARFESADGFRLSIQTINVTGADVTVAIPATAFQLIQPFIKGDDDTITMLVPPGKGQAILRYGKVVVVTQLIEGTFPDLGPITPKNILTRAVLSRASLYAACRSADIIAREASHTGRVKITPSEVADKPGHLSVVATSAESGDNVTELDAIITGPAIEIAFNITYLTEILNALDSDQVAIGLTTSTSPGTIRTVGEGDEDFVYVAMPMHIGTKPA